MSERDRIARVLPEEVLAALTAQSRAAATGTLWAAGDPGGLLRLDGGRITGAESPGAPGAEALLLRSGRILEASWVAAYQAGAPSGRFAVELVRRGLVGAAELETVCLMALFDAAFAIAAGTVEECRWEPPPPDAGPVAGNGAGAGAGAAVGTDAAFGAEPVGREQPWTSAVTRVDAWQLRAETERRLVALAQFPTPVRPGRDRLAAVAEPAAAQAAVGAGPNAGGPRAAGGLRREVLGLADGRRTARDIAFLLGRGVYPVTVEASRLLADGLVRIGSANREGGEVRALLAPRHAAPPAAPSGIASGIPSGVSSGVADPAGPVRLPRRQSRVSGS
ncbi:hypothetical protein [Streptacidiphilus anmyonensis]|uniref:hypothetical protein n=1 Tax=Streptacidiphilus anmyonensis TaxID=405782 RepID=UPI00128E1926|nr:hypothetical protein [Streptacidiphilus anmyonensis]